MRALIFQNWEPEGPGIFADVLDQNAWGRKIVHLHRGEKIPSEWQSYDLLLVMGGPMNVYEEDIYPFLASETMAIQKALEKGMPVIGFCLGAQLMAKACGAKVVKGTQREIGWYPVQFTDHGMQDPLLKSFSREVCVFQWHGDTFHLPDRAVRLATSKDYLNQAMRIDTMSYGFQFHFEMTKEMIVEWIRTGQEEIWEMNLENLPVRILKDSDLHLPQSHALGRSFFNDYLQMIGSFYRT
jgi:GMP synthase-like glutamine amidotransferase